MKKNRKRIEKESEGKEKSRFEKKEGYLWKIQSKSSCDKNLCDPGNKRINVSSDDSFSGRRQKITQHKKLLKTVFASFILDSFSPNRDFLFLYPFYLHAFRLFSSL